MAQGAVVHQFTVQLADVDRNVYADLDLRLARHPSETAEYMLTRLLAFCLEQREGLAFTDGIAAPDEPAVIARDLTGRVTAWIEVGAPDAARLHRAAKQAPRVAVYTHRDLAPLLAQLAGGKIHRAAEIPFYAPGRAFLAEAAAAIDRRNTVSLSRTESQLYLDLNGRSFGVALEEGRLS